MNDVWRNLGVDCDSIARLLQCCRQQLASDNTTQDDFKRYKLLDYLLNRKPRLDYKQQYPGNFSLPWYKIAVFWSLC